MALSDAPFINSIKKIFTENQSDYISILNSLNNEDKNKLEIYSHFYIYICNPNATENIVRQEIRLVGITSIIEVLMEDKNDEYMDVFMYFKTKYPGENKIDDFAKFKKEYLEKFGATKKVRDYFSQYVSKEDKTILCSSIQIFDKKNGKFVPLRHIEQFANFLYQMRSDFVHKAAMPGFCPLDAAFAGRQVGKDIYTIEIDIDSVLKIFERSFVKFWDSKTKI